MINIDLIYTLFLKSNGIVTDSRKVIKGCLFWALKGENFDGNNFAQQAIEDGAIAAIIDNENYKNNNFIYVNNTLEALQKLATHHRRQFDIPVIGITGSNGKTTTKELVLAVLQKKYNTLATIGNLNNHIGVPLTLLRLNSSHEIAIIEMGANHREDIKELAIIAEPNYGIITSIGKAHIGEFGSFDDIIYAKTRLYHFVANSDGKLFVNNNLNMLVDLAQKEYISKSENIVFYGNEHAKFEFKFKGAHPFVLFSYNDTAIQTQLIGDYNYNNAITATTVGLYFGVSIEDIKDALENYMPANNRSQIIKQGSNTIILDAYNANPTSMMAALETLSNINSNRKIAILGDMNELGEYTDQEHKVVLEYAEQLKIDIIVLVGKYFSKINKENVLFFENYFQAKEWYENQTLNDTTILIKGSRSIQLEKILN